jgi:hypothetical protein
MILTPSNAKMHGGVRGKSLAICLILKPYPHDMSSPKFDCFGAEFGIVTGIDEPPFDPTEKYIITPRYCSDYLTPF